MHVIDFFVPFLNGPTIHQPKGDLDANGPPSLLCRTSGIANAFAQFALISNAIYKSDFLGTLSTISLK